MPFRIFSSAKVFLLLSIQFSSFSWLLWCMLWLCRVSYTFSDNLLFSFAGQYHETFGCRSTLWCRGTCYMVNMFGPLFCSSMLVYIWKRTHEVKVCKRYERCETARTKRTFKTKWYEQIQIYISTIHAIKYFKTLVF